MHSRLAAGPWGRGAAGHGLWPQLHGNQGRRDRDAQSGLEEAFGKKNFFEEIRECFPEVVVFEQGITRCVWGRASEFLPGSPHILLLLLCPCGPA